MKMKKIIALALALVLLLSIAALVGCGNNQSGGGTAPAGGGNAPAGGGNAPAGGGNTPSGGGNQPDNTVHNLVTTFIASAESASGQAFQAAMDEIEERSGGRIKYTIHWGPSLLETPDILSGVAGGIADLAMFPTHAFADVFPINYNIMALPFLGVPNTAAAFDLYNQMVAEFPEIKQEFVNAGLIPIGPFFAGRLDLFMSVDANVRTPADLNGRRILVTGPYEAAALTAWGAAPVLTTMADIYQSLSGGIAEGIINHSSLPFAAGSQELIETVVLFGETGASPGMGKYIFQFVMNPRTYNNLPEDLRELLTEVIYDLGKELTAVEEANHQGHMGYYRSRGVNVIVLSDAEIAAFVQQVGNIHADNVAIAAGKVSNAQVIFDRMIELAKQYS